MDVHPTKNVSIGIDPYPTGFVTWLPGWWCNVPILKNDGVRQWEG
jgi:hypothetical protein